jgi:type I restriction enzyme S subunit
MSWEVSKLENVTSKIGDGLHGTPKYDKDGEYYFINGNNLRHGRIEIKEDTKKINFQEFQKIKKELNSQTIFVAINGTLGNIGMYNGEKIALGKSACYLNINQNAEKLFIRYVLANETFQNYAQRFATGATIKNLGLKAVRNYEFELPPLQTQKRIANILSAYDDLIENNLKRIKLLEQAAQNIYKEWFVNLRFPGHENTPINEETGLPVGWVKGTISDFGKVVTGKTPSTKKPEFYGGNMPFIKTPDMHNSCYVVNSSNKLTKAGSAVQSNKTLPKNSVMVSCIGTAGIVAITSEPSQTNQQINSVIFDSSFKTYYFYCFASRLKQLLEGLGSNGATMVNVNKGKFENIEIIIPSEDYLTKYSDKVEPMFNQILTLLSQNQKLKAARDILLPRLMNRTIEV